MKRVEDGFKKIDRDSDLTIVAEKHRENYSLQKDKKSVKTASNMIDYLH